MFQTWRTAGAAALAAALAINAAAMLLWPDRWYHAVPGVSLTGGLNLHFIRDIGCAYLVAAGGLVWRIAQPRPGWAAACAGAAFLALHGAVHLADALSGRCGWLTFWQDAPAVIGPALLAAWLAVPPPLSTRHQPRWSPT